MRQEPEVLIAAKDLFYGVPSFLPLTPVMMTMPVSLYMILFLFFVYCVYRLCTCPSRRYVPLFPYRNFNSPKVNCPNDTIFQILTILDNSLQIL